MNITPTAIKDGRKLLASINRSNVFQKWNGDNLSLYNDQGDRILNNLNYTEVSINGRRYSDLEHFRKTLNYFVGYRIKSD